MSKSNPSNVVRLDEHIKNPGLSNRTRSGSVLKHCREIASSSVIGALPIVIVYLPGTAAIGFYESLGAVAMDDWTVYRLDREAIERLADRAS